MIFFEKDGDPVRKSLLLILVLLLTVFCACAIAETEYPLEAVSGKISFNEDAYVVLTSGNLAEHPDLLSSIGKTAEELQSDWTARGVLLQAWAKGDKKTCVEVSLVQDDASAKYFDTESRTKAERREYYNEVLAEARAQGYTVIDPTIKKHEKSGNFVEFEYVLKGGNEEHRGIFRKIVRNGYTLAIDYQVYDRRPSRTDLDRSRHIVNTVVIEKAAAVQTETVAGEEAPESAATADIPAGAANTLNVSVLPPAKTNEGVFTVEGTAYPGSEIIVVAMRWSGSSYRFPTTAGKNGKFSAKVTLPDEGLYQITVNMCINNTTVADAVLNSVTYSKTVLPYTLNAEIPDVLTSDELVISGTTLKNVEIQCIVTLGGATISAKPRSTAKTNGTGAFTFKIPTDQEGEYDITLVFSKKDLNTERFNKKATRTLTDADNKARKADEAKKVNYATLVKKLDAYKGTTIVFEAHITDVRQVGDEWIITAAQKLNKGKYSNYLIYMSPEDPGLVAGTKVKLYGVCTGAYSIQSEEENTSYPGFDYLFFE